MHSLPIGMVVAPVAQEGRASPRDRQCSLLAKPMGLAFSEHGRDFVEPSEESGGYKDAHVG
jgi:hypothetical protein